MFGGSGLSLADIAAVTKGNNDGDGFGGNNGWWILIILFALFGWGNGGWGNNGNSGNSNGGGNTVVVPVPYGGYGMGSSYGASFTDAAVQRGFDTQTIITKLDGLNSGVCALGYDQLAQMNGINTNIMQTGFGLQQAINQASVANTQGQAAISTQVADCCCQNRQGQMQIQFDMATMGSALQNTMNQNTREIMQGMCTGLRDIGDKIDAGFNQIILNQKDAEIATLRQQLNNCFVQGVADAAVQSAVQQVRPSAVPAYPASNPCGMGNWNPSVLSGYGQNGGCCNWG